MSSFEGDLLDRIAASKGMRSVQKETKRLADLAAKTTEWVEKEGIHHMFEFYFKESVYDKNRPPIVPTSMPHLRGNRVTAAMDITNYTADVLGSEIADHTLAQDCAWRRRMHKHNSRTFDLEQMLSTTPAPLGRHTTKKRKRAKTVTKKRPRVSSTPKRNRKRCNTNQ